MRTPFDEPYAANRGWYDVEIGFSSGKGRRFQLRVNGQPQGEACQALGGGQGWETQRVRGVEIRGSDEIMLEVRGGAGARVDHVQLNLLSRTSEG